MLDSQLILNNVIETMFRKVVINSEVDYYKVLVINCSPYSFLLDCHHN